MRFLAILSGLALTCYLSLSPTPHVAAPRPTVNPLPAPVPPPALCDCGCLDGGECTCEVCPCGIARKPPAPPTYEQLRARAVAESRVLLVVVGCKSADCCPDVPGALVYYCDRFAALGVTQGIVVAAPRDGELWQVGYLPLGCSAADVRMMLAPAPVVPPPVFVPAFGGGSRGGC